MRLDDMPESGNVEDRRGDGGGFGGGGGMGGMPIGTGGLGIGGMVVLGLIGWALGIDPCLLINGAECRHWRRSAAATSRPTRAAAGRAPTGTPSDETGRFVSRVLGSTEVQWKDIFAKDGQTYRAPKLVMFSRPDALGLRRGAERDGAVLLPERPRGLSRHRRSSAISRRASAAAAARPASSPRPM